MHTSLRFLDSSFSKRVRIAGLCLLLAMTASQAAAQVTVAAGTGSAAAGGTVALAISLTSSGASPAATQWTIGYPAATISSVTVAAGASASAAGKALTCAGGGGVITCVAYGINQNAIGAGILATATFTVAATAQAASLAIQVSGVVAVSAGGSAISASGLAGGITVTSSQTWTISGAISPAASGSGATVTLSGAASATTTANSSGAYSFTGLANGSYTVTPSKSGYSFAPVNSAVTVNGASQTSVNFTASSGPPLRNDFTGFVGMQFTVASSPLSVSTVGRICVAGNSATHTVELVSGPTGAVVAAASVNMANCPGGQFVYAPLTSPATLQAGASYYLASLEQAGGDYWYDTGPISPLPDVSVTNSAYAVGSTWYAGFGPNTSYVPPSMQYTVGSNSATPFVVTYNLNNPSLRSDFTGYVGLELTVGSSPITVVSLGRMCVAGNSLSHTLEFVNASTGATVTGGSVTLSMSGCQAGQFAYAGLSSPITLQAGSAYYLVSSEIEGGDQWYDAGTLTSTAVAAVTHAAYAYPGQSLVPAFSAGWSYGPLNFEYSSNTSGTPLITAYGLSNPPLRNDFSGWVGLEFTTGAGGMTVHSLGRIFVAGNSGTHTVKLVLASNGTDVSGATASVSMEGGSTGTFAYVSLPSPVTLQANTSYYLVSQEAAGGDQWYDLGSISTTSSESVPSAIWSPDGTNWYQAGGVNDSYVPPNLE